MLVCVRKSTVNINIYLRHRLIARVSSLKYLGSSITDDGRSMQDIKQRIGQEKTEFIKKKKILILKKN